jgi:hypothetical protein
MQNFLAHWKTTVQGFLSFFIVSAITIQVSLGAIQTPSHREIVAGIILNTSLALAKVWISLLQKDAGTVTAVVPNAGVQQVPAHETPDNPAATPVVKP